MNKPQLIVASAGSGKTYTLTERLCALIRAGIDPSAISALTFSRAAAGEIYMELVKRIAESGDPAPMRRLIDRQHQLSIGTIDAFLMRMVRLFPLELGLQREVSIMDGFAADEAWLQTMDLVMRAGAESSDRLVAALKDSRGVDTSAKSWYAEVEKSVRRLSDTLCAHPDIADWRENAARALGVECTIDPADARSALDAAMDGIAPFEPVFDGICDRSGKNVFSVILAYARDFRGKSGSLPTAVKNLFVDWTPGKGVGSYKYNRKTITLNADASAAFDRFLGAILDLSAAYCLRRTRGLYEVADSISRIYARNFTERGRLTFEDLPRLVASLGEEIKDSLDYRLGVKLDEWALDEFQDTSRIQYAVLERQLENASGAFVVGDPKQAIYRWRGGDVGVFAGLFADSSTDPDEPGKRYVRIPKRESFRYGPEICAAVNRIFAPANLGGIFGDGAAVRAWNDYWLDHRPDADHTAPGEVSVAEMDDSEDLIADAAKRIRDWMQIKLRIHERGLTAAVLVRRQDDGKLLTRRLVELGVDAVWEGDSPVVGSTQVAQILEVLRHAEHPESKFSENLILRSPLRRGDFDISPENVQASLSRLGLARTLQELVRKLPADMTADIDVARSLDRLVRAAARFEAQADERARVDDFVRFVRSETVKGAADFPGVVRVMTIHHSKGLGFEVVSVPDLEGARKGGEPPETLAGTDWVLARPDKLLVAHRPAIAQAAEADAQAELFERFCVAYVSVTRAKRHLQLLLRPSGSSGAKSFSALVRAAGVESVDNAMASESSGGANPAPAATDVWANAPTEESDHLVRVSPSRHGGGRWRIAGFFREGPGATEFGTALHEKLAKIEWATAEELAAMPEHFREAFVKPSPDAAVWRERAYELALDGKWESGQFDRVVFSGAGAERRAVIYDFKTNSRLPGESDEDFVGRLERQYDWQLGHYRAALAKLTGLSASAISARLLIYRL